MPWKLEVSGSPAIIEVIYEGDVAAPELEAAFASALAEGIRRQSPLFLANLVLLTGGHSIIDLMDIVTRIEAGGIDRRFREAVLVPPGTPIGPHAEFYETACRNRGFNARVFNDREEALAWLHKAVAPGT